MSVHFVLKIKSKILFWKKPRNPKKYLNNAKTISSEKTRSGF